MIKSADRTKLVELSSIRKLFEIMKPGDINLGIGEPDFNVPENIKNAMKNALDENYTHYPPVKGFPNLQEAIAEKLKKENKIETESNNIILTTGASEAIYISLQAFINKGNEVILSDPSFLSYKAAIELCRGIPVFADCFRENDFKLKAEDVEDKITENTKAILINSPSNPTGAVMDKEDIKAIADLATDKDILIISDEIYEKIIYNKKHISPGAYSDNVITINGFSKSYAMTGLRIGYLNAGEHLNTDILKTHQFCTTCVNSISQFGALEALKGPQDSVNKMVKEFKRRRDFMVHSLNSLGYPTIKSEGAFYVFPQVEDLKFVEKAAKKGVLFVPGKAFGPKYKDHVRMSYATSYDNLKIAIERLEDI